MKNQQQNVTFSEDCNGDSNIDLKSNAKLAQLDKHPTGMAGSPVQSSLKVIFCC